MKKPGLIRRAIGSAIASVTGWLGAYNSTDPRRKDLEGWVVQKATANQALAYNHPTIVNQCRQLERNCPSARAVIEGLVADIIGTGIDVAPDTGSPARDDKIKEKWQEWAEHAGVSGESLWELQAQAVREICTSGGPLWRFVNLPERVKEGKLPLAILALESEWLSTLPVADTAAGNVFVNGVEVDRLGRPQFYHLIDPNLATAAGVGQKGERVPANQICYAFERRRAGQVIGEPLLAPLIERFKQEEDLVKIELAGAKISANFAVAVMSEYHEDAIPAGADASSSTDPVVDISPGTVTRLYPGEKVEAIQSNRPNQLIAAFRAELRGDIAACARTSKKWLNRDYSSATFMNTRMEQADSTRAHKPIQGWLGKAIASRVYLEALPWILLRLGTEMPSDPAMRVKLQAHKLLPDLPDYVDPLKDGEAAIQNISAGLSTREEELGRRGKDWKKVAEQRKKEMEFYESLGLPENGDMAAAPLAADTASEQQDKQISADEKAAEQQKKSEPEKKPVTKRIVRDEAGRVVGIVRE